ncbi:MAG: hypothetical protein FJZ15_06865, partial [Candidatus Omnitrophica bacterium]|nr:hypothetical protein [Candidatus Omnitrophota bacterium]
MFDKHMPGVFLTVLFFWISFIPEPVQWQYGFAMILFLVFNASAVVVKRGAGLFARSDFYVWIFIACIGANIFFASERYIAMKGYLNLALPMLLIYYIIKESVSFGRKFELLAKIISFCSILVALGGVLEAFFAFNPLYENWIKNPFYEALKNGFIHIKPSLAQPGFMSGCIFSPASTQYHPTVLGSYLLGSLPFNFLLFRDDRPVLKLLGSTGLILGITVIILSFSRSAFLGLIAMIILYLLMQKRYCSVCLFFIFLFIFMILCSYLPH